MHVPTSYSFRKKTSITVDQADAAFSHILKSSRIFIYINFMSSLYATLAALTLTVCAYVARCTRTPVGVPRPSAGAAVLANVRITWRVHWRGKKYYCTLP